mgnify:CR=1 FL=1
MLSPARCFRLSKQKKGRSPWQIASGQAKQRGRVPRTRVSYLTLDEIPGRHNRTPINDGETGHKGNGKRDYSADHDAVGGRCGEGGSPASGQQAHAYANEQVGCADGGKKPRESLCHVG